MTPKMFVVNGEGEMTLPVWIDHVGSAGPLCVTGSLIEIVGFPKAEDLPQIPLR